MKYQVIGPNDPALEVLATQLKAHPEWETTLTILPWAEYQSKVTETLQASTSTYQALCIPGHIWLPGFADAGQLAAFEELLPNLPADRIDAYKSAEIMPSVADECRYNNSQYILPLFTDGHILFFRKDVYPLIENNSVPIIDPCGMPEILENAHLKEGMYPFALKAHSSEILTDWLPYLWAFGGEILDAKNQPAFNSEAAISALEFYISLKRFCPPETHNFGNQEIADALKQGRVAMAASWGGQAAMILNAANPFNTFFGSAIFTSPWNATWGVSIPANQPLSEQINILNVLYAAASPAQDLLVTQIAGSPVRSTSYSQEEFSKYSWLPAQHEMLQRCKTLPANPVLARYLGALYQAVYLAFTGEKTPQNALNQAAN
jgi:multiple sugar transport system substrate-binding protein